LNFCNLSTPINFHTYSRTQERGGEDDENHHQGCIGSYADVGCSRIRTEHEFSVRHGYHDCLHGYRLSDCVTPGYLRKSEVSRRLHFFYVNNQSYLFNE
jgi:hypothetical protein